MRLILLSFVFLSVLMSVGCSRSSADQDVIVTPPPPPSSWFASDSVEVANELVPMLLKRSWIADFKQRTGQQPKVALGPISDRSQGSIDLEVYRGELLRALAEGGMVQVVETREAADFLLKGSVGANDGTERDVPVRRYQIDLVIVERVSGDVATPSISIEKQKDDRASETPSVKPAVLP